MKIYEKPMAIIETIEVEDVITASAAVDIDNLSDATKAAILSEAGTDDVILFQW